MLVPFLVVMLIYSVAAQTGHPEFDLEFEQVVLEEGNLEKVECIANGEQPLRYTWYDKKDAEVPYDTNQEIFSRNTEKGNSLIFSKVKKSHAGLYSCSATNKHGTASKSYDIIVNSTSGKITTNETAEIVSVKVINITENSVEFYVETSGDPESFYIAYKEKVVRGELLVQIKKSDRAVVRNLVPGGSYDFWFQINRTSRVPSTRIQVIMLPGVPDVIFRSVQNGFVNVEWFRSIDEFSRNTIQEYELSYNIVRQVGGKTWESSDCVITIKIPYHNCGSTRYTIAGLEKGIYYEIRLRMRTSSGYGKPYINKVYIES